MSGYSTRSQELASQLHAKAAENLERSGKTVVRSANSGRFVTKVYAARHSATTISEGKSDGGQRFKG